jgi:acetyltransferase EpsM
MILYGASGHGKVVAEILRLRGIDDLIFVDDNPGVKLKGEKIILPDFTGIKQGVLVTIGLNNVRRDIVKKNPDLNYHIAIHPKSVVSSSVHISEGTVVMAGAVINCDSKVGAHVIVNSNAVIEHDCEVSNFAHISPNATLCGGVKLGEGVWIGAGSTIKNGITIGKWAIVGAGSVVISDVPDYAIVVGIPAVFLKQNVEHR